MMPSLLIFFTSVDHFTFLNDQRAAKIHIYDAILSLFQNPRKSLPHHEPHTSIHNILHQPPWQCASTSRRTNYFPASPHDTLLHARHHTKQDTHHALGRWHD
jgi:hypothetical protein